MWETQVRSLGREDPLEREMATHSSTLACKIPWTEKSDRLQYTGSQRVGHDWMTSLSPESCFPVSSGNSMIAWYIIWPTTFFLFFFLEVLKSVSGSSFILKSAWCFQSLFLKFAAAKLLQLCPTLCNPRDGSPPGFLIPGILQARTQMCYLAYVMKKIITNPLQRQ